MTSQHIDVADLKAALGSGAAAQRIYLDYNATSPLRAEVRAAMAPYFESGFGNAESLHREGQQARAAVEEARGTCAAVLGCAAGEVVFTSGATESANLALRGAAWAARLKDGRTRIVCSSIEHAAIRETVEALVRQGFRADVAPVDAHGVVDAKAFAAALTDQTAVAALMLANNETGVLQPVQEVSAACRASNVPLLVDAVQAAGKVGIRMDDLGAVLLMLSAHKFEGPKGAGLLAVRTGTLLESAQTGGSHEAGRRGGTHFTAGIVGLAEALKLAEAERATEAPRLRALRDRFEADLAATYPGLVVHGRAVERLANTSFLSFPGCAGESLVNALDLEGVAVSTGAACSEGTHQASHVLQAMSVPDAELASSVRVSLGRGTTAEAMARATYLFKKVLSRMNGRPA